MEICPPLLTQSIDNIISEIQKLGQERITKQIYILLTTGAYCPIHNMHIEVFKTARNYVESQNDSNIVVGGLISPSHDKYVGGKMRNSGFTAITSNHRVEMARLACLNLPWVGVSDWESTRKGFIDYPEVTKNNRNIVFDKLSNEFGKSITRQLKFVYICGADHAFRCHLYTNVNSSWCDMVLSISRPGGKGETESLLQYKSKWSDKFKLCEDNTEDLSSTKIREIMIKGESLIDYCPKEVCDYILSNKITVQKI
jgi:nicotinamide mononucleotide adenylyltransferase